MPDLQYISCLDWPSEPCFIHISQINVFCRICSMASVIFSHYDLFCYVTILYLLRSTDLPLFILFVLLNYVNLLELIVCFSTHQECPRNMGSWSLTKMQHIFLLALVHEHVLGRNFQSLELHHYLHLCFKIMRLVLWLFLLFSHYKEDYNLIIFIFKNLVQQVNKVIWS